MYLSGLIYALLAYVTWGMYPLYWKLLKEVSSEQILAHRVLWSSIFFVIFLSIRRREFFFKSFALSGKCLGVLVASAIMLGVHWGLYLYAVNTNHIVENSLGSFIVPLINV